DLKYQYVPFIKFTCRTCNYKPSIGGLYNASSFVIAIRAAIMVFPFQIAQYIDFDHVNIIIIHRVIDILFASDDIPAIRCCCNGIPLLVVAACAIKILPLFVTKRIYFKQEYISFAKRTSAEGCSNNDKTSVMRFSYAVTKFFR